MRSIKYDLRLCFYPRKNISNKNELGVPDIPTDASSIAPSEEPDVDFRKKIKYGNRIQVRLLPIYLSSETIADWRTF